MAKRDRDIVIAARGFVAARETFRLADHAIEIDDTTPIQLLRDRAQWAEEQLDASYAYLRKLVVGEE